MFRRPSPSGSGAVLGLQAVLLAVVLAGCGSTAATGGGTATSSGAGATATATSGATPAANGGMQVRFIGLADGDSAPAKLDAKGRPLLPVKIEVSGGVALTIWLTANGLPAVDAGGRQLESLNSAGADPFTGEIDWSPAAGAGTYTLVASAVDNEKNVAEATIHITVTGVPVITPLPPAMTEAQARTKVKELIAAKAHVTIPDPSLQYFSFPQNPTRSRWIGAAYYRGMRYYVQIFDDLHVEWSNGPFSDRTHATTAVYTYCRPLGTFRVLTVFVDYGNTGVVESDALAQVPVVAAWVDGQYDAFAQSHGFASSPMHIQADAAYISAPPAKGALLTAAQIKSRTGKDPAAYDFVMQIDLDANGTFAAKEFPGLMEPGGGLALAACDGGSGKFGPINIWSSIPSAAELQGGLGMDFNHELSHLFGMMDDWPANRGVPGPGAGLTDDWIPYVMLGWTDTDGDGVREIEDSTPYGTSGPKP